MLRCEYVEHGLKDISFYAETNIAACSGPPLVLRRAARCARNSETRLLKLEEIHWQHSSETLKIANNLLPVLLL